MPTVHQRYQARRAHHSVRHRPWLPRRTAIWQRQKWGPGKQPHLAGEKYADANVLLGPRRAQTRLRPGTRGMGSSSTASGGGAQAGSRGALQRRPRRPWCCRWGWRGMEVGAQPGNNGNAQARAVSGRRRRKRTGGELNSVFRSCNIR